MNISEMKRLYTQQNLGKSLISKVLIEGVVAHVRRESDDYIWLVLLADGSKELLSTNHGTLCKITKDDLLSYIHDTKVSLASLEAVLLRCWGIL